MRVTATEELNLTVWRETAQIPRPINAPGWVVGCVKGVRYEALAGDVVAVDVTTGDADAGDADLTDFARRHGLAVLIEKVDGVSRHRAPDRDRPVRCQLAPRGRDGRFRRTVGVEHAATAAPACDQLLRAGLAADH